MMPLSSNACPITGFASTYARPTTIPATSSSRLECPPVWRVSMCHYNATHEVAQFLTAMKEIADSR